MSLEPAVAQRIVAAVDGLRDELVRGVSEAVRIRSVTPHYPGVDYEAEVGGEGRVARLMAGLYERAGCEVDLFALEAGRDNCVGVLRGVGGGRSLIFNGHVDVVPSGPEDEWTGGDPWSGRIADGSVWGRGSCDMKGGVVAQAFAARALREAGVRLRGDLLLEAVVGEEMMEHELGTTACIERGYRADAAVVSEPSAPPVPLAVVPVTPGVLWFRVTVEGKPTHVAMRGETIRAGGYGAAVGVNAIDKAVLLYESFRRLEEEWGLTKRHPLFRPGHFAIHPGVFLGAPRSGLVPFVVPDSAYVDFIVWYHPDDDPDAVRAVMERRVEQTAALDGWLAEHQPKVEWKHHWPQSVVDPEHPIVAATCAAHELAAGEPATVAGFAAVEDTTWLNAAGITAISYGPGDIRVAHAVDEHVAIDELVLATKTFALLAATWCGV
jgi:acetylornithine deacetylase